MKIPLILNGEDVELEANPCDSLLKILRRQKLYSVKCGCEKGQCGNCLVLLDDRPVPSCLVKLGFARGKDIKTLEYFSSAKKTDVDEDILIYKDIISAFSTSGIHMCGYCNAGKIFTAYEILKIFKRPSAEQVFTAIKGLDTCCTDSMTLAAGILLAASLKAEREGIYANVK